MNTVVSQIKKLCSFEADTLSSSVKNPSGYGEKAWANAVLREAIEELYNSNRVLSARNLEVFYFLGELERFGFKWQVARLRNHINLAVKRGRFTISKEIDPKEVVGGLSPC